jgi:hypothetical protein
LLRVRSHDPLVGPGPSPSALHSAMIKLASAGNPAPVTVTLSPAIRFAAGEILMLGGAAAAGRRCAERRTVAAPATAVPASRATDTRPALTATRVCFLLRLLRIVARS